MNSSKLIDGLVFQYATRNQPQFCILMFLSLYSCLNAAISSSSIQLFFKEENFNSINIAMLPSSESMYLKVLSTKVLKRPAALS